ANDQAAPKALRAMEWRGVFMDCGLSRAGIVAALLRGRQVNKSLALRHAHAEAPRVDWRSRAVVGVYLDVVVAQVAGPHRRRCAAAVQVDADRDLALLHHALTVFLAGVRPQPAPFGAR